MSDSFHFRGRGRSGGWRGRGRSSGDDPGDFGRGRGRGRGSADDQTGFGRGRGRRGGGGFRGRGRWHQPQHAEGSGDGGFGSTVRTHPQQARGHGRGRGDQGSRVTPAPPSRGTVGTSSAVQVSPDVADYWRRMDALTNSNPHSTRCFTVSPGNQTELRLWKMTWAAAAAGAAGPSLECLLKALLRMPKHSGVTPPAADILGVLVCVVAQIAPQAASSAVDIQQLEMCLDVVHKRLKGHETNEPDPGGAAAVAQRLAVDLRGKTTQVLQCLQDGSMMSRAARLIVRVGQEVDTYSRALSQAASASAQDQRPMGMQAAGSGQAGAAAAWAGWREPSLQWLLSGTWLRQVPDLCGRFSSLQEYADSLHRLMVILTFYWGAGAVWPHCQHRKGTDGRHGVADTRYCNEPLLHPCHGRNHTCTARLAHGAICGAPAAWTCPRGRSHQNSICPGCLGRKQEGLTGGSGPRASTDIYDAVVEREEYRHDGQVYVLSQVASRRPPQKAADYKTSYRLKCSALVAVAALGRSQEPLLPDLSLVWGEIVPVRQFRGSGPDMDWQQRSRGNMAVRLLKCDSAGRIRPVGDVSLSIGTRVAVIDLRIFVPEVLQVLSICADPDLCRHLEAVPFAGRLIGTGEPPEAPPSYSGLPSAALREAIGEAIRSSEIDLVQRLSPGAREQLEADITRLALDDAKLRGTQLEAFAQALRGSIHCTQGPPGTGKSYVGVQLVLALDLIRSAAMREGHPDVGPILVLSYKNHALDELLLDVLKAKSPLGTSGHLRHQRGALVRCGKAEDQELSAYTEQRTVQERSAQETLSNRLEAVRDADRTVAVWRDTAAQMQMCIAELEDLEAVRRADREGDTQGSRASVAQHQQQIAMVLSRWGLSAGAAQAEKRTAAEMCALLVALLAKLEKHLDRHQQQQDDRAGQDGNPDANVVQEEGGQSTLRQRQLLLDSFFCSSEEAHATMAQTSHRRPIRGYEAIEDMENLLPGLSSDLQHWESLQMIQGVDRMRHLLHHWLVGLVPPPRCMAVDNAGERCILQAAEDIQSPYCSHLHSCQHPAGCPLPRAALPEHIRLCNKHRCKAPGSNCLRMQSAGSSFCEVHSCPICVRRGSVPVMLRGPVVCEAHECRAPRCIRPQLSAQLPFCREEHLCVLCLQGDPCGKQAIPGTRLCSQHKCGVPACRHPVLDAMQRADRASSSSSSSSSSSTRQRFCQLHACTACEGVKAMVDDGSRRRLCDGHRCCQQLDGHHLGFRCQEPRLPGSLHCLPHTCRVCMELGLPLVQAVTDVAPRNVCEQHPLCCFLNLYGQTCSSPAAHGRFFCEAHNVPHHGHASPTYSSWPQMGGGDGLMATGESSSEGPWQKKQCSGTNKKRKRCGSSGLAAPGKQFYCSAHIDQAPSSSSSSTSSSSSAVSVVDDEDMDNAASKASAEDNVMAAVMKLQPDEHSLDFPASGNDPRAARGEGNDHQARPDAEDAWQMQRGAHPEAPLARASGIHQPEPQPQSAMPAAPPPPCPGPGAQPGHDQGLRNPSDAPGGRQLAPDAAGKDQPPQDGGGDYQASYQGHNDDDGEEGGGTEALEQHVHPDEMMLSDNDSLADDLQVNDDQERLRELLGADIEEGFMEGGQDQELDGTAVLPGGGRGDADGDMATVAAVRALLEEMAAWTWEMPVPDRLQAASILLLKGGSILAHLRRLSDGHVEAARQDLSAASALALRRARVVGATVVGAARRLEALRAAEPFAMVVEEACEVMEPTLMAVLAVESLQKLELVGDHYQLPAFVQNCWFNIESSHPSIKISLFERLVSAAGDSQGRGGSSGGDRVDQPLVLCSVLDEQRRMRPSIADLTRGQYSHLVTIQDHPCTISRRVGDMLPSPARPSRSEAELWGGSGLLIPGMLPQEFFWDIDGNAEGRPVAGLSACNYVEAEAAARLVQWLLLCGMPAPGISLITPYKGQKAAIIKALRSVVGPEAAQSTVISTVDRYQGDENDVVILSLVRTRPGNRFVALKNRFIVAASRARLGFYILGSSAAVGGRPGPGPAGPAVAGGGPLHWCGLLEHLGSPGSTQGPPSDHNGAGDVGVEKDKAGPVLSAEPHQLCDEDKEGIEEGQSSPRPEQMEQSSTDQASSIAIERFSGARIGASLPVCCPHHSATRCNVAHPQDFPKASEWGRFCGQACGQPLPWCGHECGNKCHAPHPGAHTQPERCTAELQRPCPEHKHVPLLCGDLYRSQQMIAGNQSRSVPAAPRIPFAAALPKYMCKEVVDYQRPECDHTVRMPCHQWKKVAAGQEKLPNCTVKVSDFYHPVCGHAFKTPLCWQRRSWEEEPPQCDKIVVHKRPCGHSKTMKCWEAAAELLQPTPCMTDVQTPRPRCSHSLSLRCSTAAALTEAWEQHGGQGAALADPEDPTSVIVENGVDYGASESQLARETHLKAALPACAAPVWYRMPCGHIKRGVPCATAFAWAAGEGSAEERCDSSETFVSPLCGHVVKLPCWTKTSRAWETFQSPVVRRNRSARDADDLDEGEGGDIILSEAVLQEMDALPADVAKAIRGCCQRTAKVERTCGHCVSLPCSSLVAIVAGRKDLPRCKAEVERRLGCGHSAIVQCHLKDTEPPPACQAAVLESYTYPCGRHMVQPRTCRQLMELRAAEMPLCPELVTCRRFRCGHEVAVQCHQAAAVAAVRPGHRACNGSTAPIVVKAGMGYADDAPGVAACQAAVTFEHSCGHQVNNVACTQAFQWAAEEPACLQEDVIISPLCHHDLSLPCHERQALQQWKPWGDADPPWGCVSEGTLEAEGDKTMVSPEILPDTSRPAPLPPGLRAGVLRCGQMCLVGRVCGHACRVPCERAFAALDQPCQEEVEVVCGSCEARSTSICSEVTSLAMSGRQQRCLNKVEKRCTVCRVNNTMVECYRHHVHCNREVTTTRTECGHEVSWICGEDDPRESAAPCLHCCLHEWDIALRGEDGGPHNLPGQAELLEHVLKSLPEDLEVERVDEVPEPPFQTVPDAARRITQAFRDHLHACCENGASLSTGAEAGSPPRLDNMSNFDIVFRPVAASQGPSGPAKSFTMKATPYGQGIPLRLVTVGNLQRIQPDNGGGIEVLLGLAFRHAALTESPPFVGKSKGNSKKQQEARTKANIKARQLQGAGLDHVVPQDSTAEHPTRIYWVAGAAVPLATVVLRLHMKCGICFEHKLTQEGCQCSKGHFFCWDCFGMLLESAKEQDATQRMVDGDGNLRCPDGDCTTVFHMHQVANHAGAGQQQAVFASLVELRNAAVLKEAVPAALKAERERLNAEFQRIQAIADMDERKAAVLRMEILEDILTLKCPSQNCRQAFHDYDGCAALTCSSCKTGFCAYCLANCGSDAHAHVAHCPERLNEGLFTPLHKFHEHHRVRKGRLIAERLRQEPPAVQRAALKLLKPDLELPGGKNIDVKL